MDKSVTSYVVDVLTKKLERYGVVVFYNPAGDIRAVLGELPPEVAVVEFGGSYLRVKFDAEMRFARLRQGFTLADSLLIYVNAPAVVAKEDDPLLEYSLAGTAYSETLRSLARKALGGRFTREQVDGLFDAPSPPGLAELDRWGEADAVDAAERVDRDDVGMVQLGHGRGLGLEACQVGRLGQEVGAEHFQRHRPIQANLSGQVYLAHPAAA